MGNVIISLAMVSIAVVSTAWMRINNIEFVWQFITIWLLARLTGELQK